MPQPASPFRWSATKKPFWATHLCKVGRLGDLLVDKTGVAKVAEMITVDAANLDKYADLF
jgi:hypothetical protein